MAFAIYFHIRNRESNRTLEIFDEKLHPLSVSHQNINFRMIQNIPKSITIMIPVCKLWGLGDKEGVDCYWLKLKTIILCFVIYNHVTNGKNSCDWFVMVFMACFILKSIEAVCTPFSDQYFAQLLMKTRKFGAKNLYFLKNWDTSTDISYMYLMFLFLKRDQVPEDYDRRDPEHKHIYRFVRTLFSAAQLTAECAIVTLV